MPSSTTLSLCFPAQEWHLSAQHYLKLIAASSQQNALISPALSGGTSGIAFVIQQFSQQGQRYQRTLAHLHQSLAEQISKRAYHQKPLEAGNAEIDFGVITGASGILSYLVSIPSPEPFVQQMLYTLLQYLYALTEPEQPPGQERWFCPPSLLSERDRLRYPYGCFNCGIAGPLAALSLASLTGYDHPGLRESLVSTSTWLIHHHLSDKWGITWPTVIPYESASSPDQWHALPASRTAWCYGALGIARALWFAGRAINDPHLMDVALTALKAVLHRPFSARHIDAPTLCHGHAGLLQICLRFAHESQDPLAVVGKIEPGDKMSQNCHRNGLAFFPCLL
ncbi:MAG: lanthionine synthetase C family protein [Ktedonobacteraceae bacterium]|nr:lanthionine synthetase C family protein [Ktedonobacteraceae bacterium]